LVNPVFDFEVDFAENGILPLQLNGLIELLDFVRADVGVVDRDGYILGHDSVEEQYDVFEWIEAKRKGYSTADRKWQSCRVL
jgi:hypothetical protein